jgi:hypothetical protein
VCGLAGFSNLHENILYDKRKTWCRYKEISHLVSFSNLEKIFVPRKNHFNILHGKEKTLEVCGWLLLRHMSYANSKAVLVEEQQITMRYLFCLFIYFC